MANYFAKLKAIPRNLPHGTAKNKITGVLVDKGERYGAMFAFSAAKGYYGNKFLYKNQGLDLWIGGAALLLSAGAQAFSGGRSEIAPHLERIGDAGVMSAIGSLGAAWGMDRAGRAVHVLTPGKNAGLPAGKTTVVGHIPPAVAGNYLTADQIAAYAHRR